VARIYLSSTFVDLAPFRAALVKTLQRIRQQVDWMEDYEASEERPLTKSLRDVGGCDLYIGLFAWRYGFMPPHDNPDHRSITELEYRHARDLSKPLRLYVLDDKAPWDASFKDGDADLESSKIRKLRDQLTTEHTVWKFTAKDELVIRVTEDVVRWLFPLSGGNGGSAASVLPGQADATRVGSTLQALTKLMQHSEVRDAVYSSGADFDIVRAQITQMADLKELHDLLHDLKIRLNALTRDRDSFPEESLDRVGDIYEVDFKRIIEGVEQVAQRGVAVKPDAPWLAEMSLGGESLDQAISNLSRPALDVAVQKFTRVLNTQPGRINTGLLAVARILRLSNLLEALNRVQKALADTPLDTQLVSDFNLGIEALARLERSLSGLLEDHDQWQNVDLELRQIAATLGLEGTDQLRDALPDLTKTIELLTSHQPADRALRLLAETAKLEATLEVNNPVRVKQAFRRFQQVADECFFRVDAQLRQLTDDLRAVREPLDKVVSALRLVHG
jgi:Domain of unknown function (DUF4062)